jgi:hypothetical protein
VFAAALTNQERPYGKAASTECSAEMEHSGGSLYEAELKAMWQVKRQVCPHKAGNVEENADRKVTD